MNRNLLIVGGVVLALLLLGGAGLFFMNKSSVNTQVSSNQNQPAASNEVTASPVPTATQKSLRSLLGLTGSQTCTYTDTQTGSTGTFYMSDSKVRGDITAKVENVSTVSHIYTDGKDMYLWTDNSQTGFKSNLSGLTTPTGTTATTSQNMDLDKNIDYNCTPGSVDASKFVLPASVKFSDYSSVMVAPSGAASSPASLKTTQCEACDKLTGDDKIQCLQVLKC